MKTLYLIRHAKSDWDHPDLTDFQRPLNQRGHSDAPFMADWLSTQNTPHPDLLISSPALRAQTTATFFAKALHINTSDIQIDPRIYEAFTPDLRAVIEGTSDSIQTVILFGHNPAITEFTEYLTHTPIGNMPTCAICRISLPITSWQEATAAIGNLDFFVFPKALRT